MFIEKHYIWRSTRKTITQEIAYCLRVIQLVSISILNQTKQIDKIPSTLFRARAISVSGKLFPAILLYLLIDDVPDLKMFFSVLELLAIFEHIN